MRDSIGNIAKGLILKGINESGATGALGPLFATRLISDAALLEAPKPGYIYRVRQYKEAHMRGVVGIVCHGVIA
ncbi:MAG: hypothetical protein IJQ81_09725 [Oscillibacter sp.]|nr:hypothetical protein [Oscillibacter sp.]